MDRRTHLDRCHRPELVDVLEHQMSELRRLDPRANDHHPERQANLDCIQHCHFPRESVRYFFFNKSSEPTAYAR